MRRRGRNAAVGQFPATVKHGTSRIAEPAESGAPAAASTDSGTEGTLTRAEYFAERHLLLEARQRSYQRMEQMIAGGATGALVLSITFLEKFAPGPDAREGRVLVVAWVCLLLALLASLISQYASARAFDCEIERLEATLHGHNSPRNNWAACNQVTNFASTVLFLIGVALLAQFAYTNAPFNRGVAPNGQDTRPTSTSRPVWRQR